MILNDKEKIILLQNLTNRATEVEIHNATIEQRTINLENISKLITEFGKIVAQKMK